MRFLFLLFISFSSLLFGQVSSFDNNNEGWTADGDAENNAAVWRATGGKPDGYVETKDGSIGGTWYFVAPAKFRGIKTDAYDKFLRYDQFVSDVISPTNRPDVELKGGGLTMVFNNPVTPGTSWTHYDILLREDAGWRINSLNGAVPTKAQFEKMLCNITSLRIRGEYVSQGEDFGGLDNVVLESEFFFVFTLDDDGSSGAIHGDFLVQPRCIPSGPIIDIDPLLTLRGAIVDSISIQVVGGSAQEELLLDVLLGNILVKRSASGLLTLVNDDGSAIPEDFILLLQNVTYVDNSPDFLSGTRIVEIKLYLSCCDMVEKHYAYLPINSQPNAGTAGDTVLCYGSGRMDLRNVLHDNPNTNGRWQPPLFSGSNFFDPDVDTAGTYTYIVPEATPCSGDSAQVRVKINYPFHLRPDTTICYTETLLIEAPRGLSDWTWSDGSQKLRLPVEEPGVYKLVGSTAYCTYSDSVNISFYNCTECPPYAPNVFSPNDDGNNDNWHIFLNCHWSRYHLEVYDRWGALAFVAEDPESSWNGRVGDREAPAGVYVWRMVWTGELYGVPKTWNYDGDLTIVR